jgi:phosphoribosyl 1,2-cyclic phosphodiesterase
MRCIALASGSKGNCLYIEADNGALLVDAGLSRKEFLRRLGEAGGDKDLICGILVTHEHTDHISGVDALARHLSVPVYATGGTLCEFLERRKCTRAPVRAQRLCYDEQYQIGDFTIQAFETSHDAREPAGFTIRENGIRIGCCTDTGVMNARIRERLMGCDALVLESNHCPEMLRDGPYPEMLKRRIRSRRGHLSNHDAAGFLRDCCPDIHEVMLAHLSEINNTPEKAMNSAQNGLGIYLDSINITIAQNPGPSNGWPGQIRI